MDVVLTGVVKEILPLQQGVSQRTGNTWQSQDYVLEHEPGQYPKSVCFKVFGGEKIANMAIKLGETITAHLNIDCHQGNTGLEGRIIDSFQSGGQANLFQGRTADKSPFTNHFNRFGYFDLRQRFTPGKSSLTDHSNGIGNKYFSDLVKP